MAEKKRICVVGGGRWGTNHIRTLDAIGHLGGFVEPEASTRGAHAANFPDAEAFASLDDALAAGMDGFTVATPAETHFDITAKVIAAGHHVLVEKPLALTAADARTLKAKAEARGVNLMVGHVMLFHPAVRKLEELIRGGKIGKLEYIYSNRLNLGTVRTEENILWSFAPHDISIFQAIIGDQPIEVISRGGAFLRPETHDTTMTVLRYPNNVVGHIFVSWLHPFKEHRLVAIGSKGMLSFEDSSDAKEILFYEKGIDWVQGEPKKREGPTESIPYERKMPLTAELSYFVDRLDGSAVEISGAHNAVEVLDILERATDSLLDRPASSRSSTALDYFVHETALVDEGCVIGAGTKVWHFAHIQKNARIGQKCSFGQNVNVGPGVEIGDHVKVQNNVSVYEGVTLEDYVFCGPSMVFTNVGRPRAKYPQPSGTGYAKTLVKEGATLGANCTIVCGHTVGRHAFVAAGAVVAKDVPDYAMMVGVPAKRIGWVCECGSSLPSELVCPSCRRRYAEDADVLSELSAG
jgi:UDP-2-acetamido-3-amino-2,3-dideoxy-glucuronate N-acetyltransferase